MERYLKVDRFIEKVWVVHSKPQVKAQRAIIASVSRAALQSTEIRSKSYKVEFLIDQQEDRQQIARLRQPRRDNPSPVLLVPSSKLRCLSPTGSLDILRDLADSGCLIDGTSSQDLSGSSRFLSSTLLVR